MTFICIFLRNTALAKLKVGRFFVSLSTKLITDDFTIYLDWKKHVEESFLSRRKLFPSLSKLEKLIESNGFNIRITLWDAMPAAAGLDIECFKETVRRAIKTKDFWFCVTCKKQWVSPKLMGIRRGYCHIMLEKYTKKKD